MERRSTTGDVAVYVAGKRSDWMLEVVVRNLADADLELNELHLPWGYQTSLQIEMIQDPSCPALEQYAALENSPMVSRYVVIPYGSSVKGRVSLLDRWPGLRSRQPGCTDGFRWKYSFSPRNSDHRHEFAGEVDWLK
jgi:hypothetical protein